MAIAFDAASTSKSASTTSLSWSHTCTGSDLILVVAVSINDPGDRSVSSVTYNSVSLSLIGTATASATVRVELWYLIAPTTGANTVEVALNKGSAIVAGATSWTGVDQSTPLGTMVTATGTGTAVTVTASTSAGEMVVDVLAADDGPTAAADGSQTERWDDAVTGVVRGAASSESSGDGNVVMSWTLGSSKEWEIAAVPIKAGGGGAGANETTLTEVWAIPARTEPLNIGGASFSAGLLAEAMATKYPHLLSWRVEEGRFKWHDLGPLLTQAPLDAMAIGDVPVGGTSDLGSLVFGVESHSGVMVSHVGPRGVLQRRYSNVGGLTPSAPGGLLFGSREEFQSPHQLEAVRIWGEDFQQAYDYVRFAYRWDRQRWYEAAQIQGLPAEIKVDDPSSGMFLEWLVLFVDSYPWEPTLPTITRVDVLAEPVELEVRPEANTQTPTVD